jgi:O-antigen/teichoic acid export membrane protein
MGLGKTIFRHTAIYSAATVLGRLVGFLMLPFYSHIFQAEGYGVIGMIETSIGIFTVLLIGAFQMGILRIYHEQDESRKGLTMGTGIRLVWGIGGLLILPPLIFSAPLSRFVLGSAEYYPLFCLSLITFVIDVAGQSASTIQIIRQQSLLFSLIGLIRLIIGLGLDIWLVVILRVGLIGVFISSFVSAVVSSMAFHYVAAREHGLGFDRQIAVELLRFQLPLLPGELITFFGRQAERIIVRILLGLGGMGVLEMAYRFPPLLNLFINIPFQRAWRTKSIEIAAQDGAPRIIGDMFTRYLFLMVFVGLILAVTIRSLLELMTPPDFWPAARITQVEVVTTILSGCSGYMAFGLVYHKRTKTLSLVRSVLVPPKIALGVTLISTLGLLGAAYSAMLIEGITLAWLGQKSQKLYRIPLEYGKIAVIILAAGFLFWLLDGNSYADFRPAIIIREEIFSPLVAFVRGTSLGEWKSGKLVQLIQAKQDVALRAILNAVFSLAFLALFPLLRGRKEV